MSNTTATKLTAPRAFAQYFTMTSAVLSGLTWLVTGLAHTHSHVLTVLSSVFIVATSIGGVTMGVLYLAAGRSKKAD